ncbi:MAG: Lrp/AsnC ligand binding domain-containing protein [Candidatus Bathyarchaeia archaeon]
MPKACILIKVVPPKAPNVLKQVKAIENVRKAYIAFGRWDIVAFLTVANYTQLKDITQKINSLNGVRSTETLAEA